MDVDLMTQLKLAGLPAPVAEYEFTEHRGWRTDWAWLYYRVALEQEGGIYGRGKTCPLCKRKRAGAHSSVSGLLRDIEKYNTLAIEGWLLVRVLPEDVASGKALGLIERALRARGWKPWHGG